MCKGLIMRTFEDFVKHAQRAYGEPDYRTMETYIFQRLDRKGLSHISVVCYINWCDNEYLTQAEIAAHLKITPQAVSYHVKRLRDVWPWLPAHPHTKGQGNINRRSSDFGRMKRLDNNTLNNVDIKMKW